MSNFYFRGLLIMKIFKFIITDSIKSYIYKNKNFSLSQTYPRLSSTAEKLWSFNTRNTPGEEEFQRLADFRCKMMSRGVPVAARITFKKRPDRMFWNHCQKPFSYNLDVL